ncbi:hypothetical protein CP97_14725 [Aurantiacibacter atlanticus]|uniref:Uncharacterized protein n=1 Tax=Aurantiacibacter atlanticus TaxID=1648404 RepID=A0A161I462_9SPHN|nr:hypothetical protein CP97_14725 [Aurantiacibacter atlanticus]
MDGDIGAHDFFPIEWCGTLAGHANQLCLMHSNIEHLGVLIVDRQWVIGCASCSHTRSLLPGQRW